MKNLTYNLCQCGAVPKPCRATRENSIVFHKGRHVPREDAITAIIESKEWRGAIRRVEKGVLVLNKGTAWLRLKLREEAELA